MTDLTNLQAKVNDLKAKVADSSITPKYLGSLLDDFIEQMKSIDLTNTSPEVHKKLLEAISYVFTLRLYKFVLDWSNTDDNTLSLKADDGTVVTEVPGVARLSDISSLQTTLKNAIMQGDVELRWFNSGNSVGLFTKTGHELAKVSNVARFSEIEALRDDLATLTDNRGTAVIDSIHEFEQFLAGFTNSDSLAALLKQYDSSIRQDFNESMPVVNFGTVRVTPGRQSEVLDDSVLSLDDITAAIAGGKAVTGLFQVWRGASVSPLNMHVTSYVSRDEPQWSGVQFECSATDTTNSNLRLYFMRVVVKTSKIGPDPGVMYDTSALRQLDLPMSANTTVDIAGIKTDIVDIDSRARDNEQRIRNAAILPFDGIWNGSGDAPAYGVWYCPNDEGGWFFRSFDDTGFYGFTVEDYNDDLYARNDRVYRLGSGLFNVKDGKLAATDAGKAGRLSWVQANGRRWGEYAHGMMPLRAYPGVVYKVYKNRSVHTPRSTRIQGQLKLASQHELSDKVDFTFTLPEWFMNLVHPDSVNISVWLSRMGGESINLNFDLSGNQLFTDVLRYQDMISQENGWYLELRYNTDVDLYFKGKPLSYVMIDSSGKCVFLSKDMVIFPRKHEASSRYERCEVGLIDPGHDVEIYRTYRKRIGLSPYNKIGATVDPKDRDYVLVSDWKPLPKGMTRKSKQVRPRSLLRVRPDARHEWQYYFVGMSGKLRASSNGHLKGRTTRAASKINKALRYCLDATKKSAQLATLEGVDADKGRN